ncbi:uncharacterized protein L201_007251 [Kwoniella dendrophila CBS 6074]|uniref:Uncharacterized protein n=1 Tax=Kwoniella dendrophila CBS 6074 TaxID=1295534 RepID=A0AAX4K3W5_9TREE
MRLNQWKSKKLFKKINLIQNFMIALAISTKIGINSDDVSIISDVNTESDFVEYPKARNDQLLSEVQFKNHNDDLCEESQYECKSVIKDTSNTSEARGDLQDQRRLKLYAMIDNSTDIPDDKVDEDAVAGVGPYKRRSQFSGVNPFFDTDSEQSKNMSGTLFCPKDDKTLRSMHARRKIRLNGSDIGFDSGSIDWDYPQDRQKRLYLIS